ncbi:MAG: DUF4124 domain-containing protein [Pseudomonadales bacterium]|nr:DUF4124 domain-containing protein [Pseudomonadales bacterium]
MAIWRSLPVFCILVSMSAMGQIYSWIDEDGNRHFSDEPPAEEARQVREENIELHNIDRGYPPGVVVDPEREVRKREKVQQQVADAQKKREVCAEAKRRLKILSGRVIFTDEQGNDIPVSEKERAEMARKFRAQVAEYCDE